MISRIDIRQLVAAFIVAVVAIVAAQRSFAQAVFTNPPCAAVSIVNNHPTCTATVNFATNPAGIWPPFTLAPGTARFLPVPAGGVKVLGMFPTGGGAIVFRAPPGPTPPCSTTAWWATNVQLNPPPACLFTICVDPVACTITLN